MSEIKQIDLTIEIELRKRLNEQYDALARALTESPLSVVTPGDVEALALLLLETIESRKSIEKQEKQLKSELRRHFPDGADILIAGSVVAIIDRITRTDLDRELMTRELGPEFIARYAKKTEYEKLTLKKKGG